MNALKNLKQIAGVFSVCESPKENKWEIESELPLPLPPSYKLMVKSFGTGRFGSNICFLNPAANGNVRLGKKELIDYSAVRKGAMINSFCTFVPKRNGIFRIAHCTARSDLCFKLKNKEWALFYVDYDFESLTLINFTVPEFIFKLYKNELDVEIFQKLSKSNWNGKQAFFTPFETPKVTWTPEGASKQKLPLTNITALNANLGKLTLMKKELEDTEPHWKLKAIDDCYRSTFRVNKII